MISIDDHEPSDPSSHQQQNSHDLKVSDTDLKSTDADLLETNNPLPNFSIRDYVFGLRSKDIACNWPFSSASLKLCLKHGVKNLLPPFESLDCLRNKSSLTPSGSKNRLTDKELVSSFDDKAVPVNDRLKSKEELSSTRKFLSLNPEESKGVKESQSGQAKSKEKPATSSQKPENASINIITKKSRLVVKVNSGVEHIAANSETMASKVCPVCKVFSSSSNTTLNAHIDQCLTGEGTMKWTDNSKVIVKHKVKPRKMRLMVDIYKTASHCTVEELDRRNGTSWATNSSFPDQEFQEEEEKEEKVEEEKEDEPTLTKVNSEVADKEGHVYIDPNGKKVRILSVPKIRSSHKLEGPKLIMGKKNNLYKKKHHRKFLKLTPNARKLCSRKPKTIGGDGEDIVMTESCSKDEREKETVKVVDLGISRPSWACSKRTDRVSKKFNRKRRKVELSYQKPNDLVVGSSGKSLSGSDPPSSRGRKSMITSLTLFERPLNRIVKFRKKVTPLHDNDDLDDDDGDDDDDDDDVSSDASPSRYSDDDGNGSDDDDDDDDDDYEDVQVADNRSKGIKFPSLNKNQSLPTVRFSFKRKFSAVQRSRVKSTNGPSLDSSKEQSGTEERTVVKKKQESRSDTSKSSNEESCVGIQKVNGNGLESVGSGPLLSIRAPSFMGLSTSFDPEFSNQDCIELYQDQICSTNRAPNDVEKQENYFKEVDPILIPGPPGSFLPASPGGEMVSEEQVQEAMVQSSENQLHHDTMDQDSMSNSPVSTISNSRSSCGKDDMYAKPYFNSRAGFTETGQSYSSFKNDQPCCCARKEAALKFQDPYTSRKQPTESKSLKSETFSVNNHPISPAIDSTASPAKPVLRLMGKNLTVVKTDEDEFRSPQSSQPHPKQPMIFGPYQNGFETQHFNNNPSKSHVNFGPIHRGFTPPVGCYGNAAGPYLGPVKPDHIHDVLDLHMGRNVHNAASSTWPAKEMVIIDDSRENEDDDNTMHLKSLKGSQGPQTNLLYTVYPPYVGSSSSGGGGGSPVVRGGSFQTSLDNGNVAGKWNIGSSTAYHPPSYP